MQSSRQCASCHRHSRWCFVQGTQWDKPWYSSPQSTWNSLKLNPDKIQFRTRECKFFKEVSHPGWHECRSNEGWCYQVGGCSTVQNRTWKFQGMVNYLKHYSSQLTQLAEPLKELLRNDTLWCSETKHQKAFETIKDELMEASVLAYFDQRQTTSYKWVGPWRASVQ